MRTCLLLVLLVARPFYAHATTVDALPKALHAEKHYREAAWFVFLDDPANALLRLQLSPAVLAEADLLEAGLLLQLHMPQAAMVRLQQLLENGQQATALTQHLRNIILLQFARYQLEQGQQGSAADYLQQLRPPYADFAGQYYLLRQLIFWPNATLTQAELQSAESVAELPYLLSNQALMSIQLGQYALAQQQLQQFGSTLRQPASGGFWRQLFASQYEAKVSDPTERLALQDYQNLLQAQLFIAKKEYANAQRVLSQFASTSVLAQPAMQLYAEVLKQTDQLPALQAVLNAHIEHYPWHSASWQAAYQLGEQFSQSQQYRHALVAHRSAERFYQQSAQFLTKDLVLTPAQILSPATSSNWLVQQLQLPELAFLQQQLLQHQQLEEAQQQRQRRLDYLQQVITHKLQQQQQLLATAMPQLQQQLATMLEQHKHLQALMSQAEHEGMQAIFWQGEHSATLARLTRAKARLPQLELAEHPQFEQYQQRLRLLEGVLSWQFEQDRAARRWQWKKTEQQLAAALVQGRARLTSLSRLSGQTPDLERQQRELAQLNLLHKQQVQLLKRSEQQLMQQIMQRLQGVQQEQLALLTLWQQQNTAAIARLVEHLLRDGEQAP